MRRLRPNTEKECMPYWTCIMSHIILSFPVVCFDEKSKQLLGDARKPIPLKPGGVLKVDYEYKRKGTCNIFVAVEPKAGRHYTEVTDCRKRKDFAEFMKWLIEVKYKNAKKVRIVLDNLNTHFEKSIYETFPEQEANKLLKKFNLYIHQNMRAG